ncbi:hypothetical protein, partial [Ferruginibacter sp.]
MRIGNERKGPNIKFIPFFFFYKQFITVCFTTEQIKNLGALFIKEEERYKFYVGAFPFVSDSHNY